MNAVSRDEIPLIETEGLSKWFGEVVAVNNLNLSIPPGIVGLLGPNGAGKSTFIRLVLGMYRPSRGIIRVYGEPPRNNLGILRRVGFCPETDSFYDGMTGLQFVTWLARYGGISSKEARKAAEASCEQVNMTGRMHDPITSYSKGMRQRIKIAQALVMNPDFLILDEPMQGLDPPGREEMFSLIKQFGSQGRSVLVSSHILYEIERVTNDVLLLNHGCVLAHGSVREIRDLIDEHPHAVLIESPDRRRIAGRFVSHESTISVEYANGAVVVRTRDPNGLYESINQGVVQDGWIIESMTCPDDDLQSVFEYLIH